MPGQRRQRDAERAARLAAIAHAQALRENGLSAQDTSAVLRLAPRTLRRWTARARAHDDALEAKQIGRKAKRGSPHLRTAVLTDLVLRPRLGLPRCASSIRTWAAASWRNSRPASARCTRPASATSSSR